MNSEVVSNHLMLFLILLRRLYKVDLALDLPQPRKKIKKFQNLYNNSSEYFQNLFIYLKSIKKIFHANLTLIVKFT